jgi:hypothetical protein
MIPRTMWHDGAKLLDHACTGKCYDVSFVDAIDTQHRPAKDIKVHASHWRPLDRAKSLLDSP